MFEELISAIMGNPLFIVIAICLILVLLLWIWYSKKGKRFAWTCLILLFVFLWIFIVELAVMPLIGSATGTSEGLSFYDGMRVVLYVLPLTIIIWKALAEKKQKLEVIDKRKK